MTIEELAFKNKVELANLNEIDLLDIIEFLQNDRKQWINQFSKTHNESVEIQKENQKLKKQLEYEKKRASYWYNVTLSNACLISGKSLHQKMFLKYLVDEIYSIEPKGTRINYSCEYDSEEDYINAIEERSRLNTLKEILQKYKEIIGVLDENKTTI